MIFRPRRATRAQRIPHVYNRKDARRVAPASSTGCEAVFARIALNEFWLTGPVTSAAGLAVTDLKSYHPR